MARKKKGETKKKKGQRDDGRFRVVKVINGERREFFGKTMEDAKRKRDEEMDKTAPKNYRDVTLAKWLDEWLNDVKADNIRANSWERYESICRVHIIPNLGGMKLADIQTPHVRSFLTERKNVVVCRKKKPTPEDLKKAKKISPRTLQYIYVTLNAAFEQARVDKIIADNPCEPIEKPAVAQKQPKPYTDSEVTAYLAQIAEHPLLYPLSMLDLDTGMRLGELLGLKWVNINLDSGKVQIAEATMQTREKGTTLDLPKNDASIRTITLPRRSRKVLQAHKESQERHKKQYGIRYKDRDLVFADEHGDLIPNYKVSKLFKRAAMKAGLRSDAKFHNLRDTHATDLLELGEHPFKVQARLGHASLQMTRRYSKSTPQHQEGIAEKLDQKHDGQNEASGQKVVKRQRIIKKISLRK